MNKKLQFRHELKFMIGYPQYLILRQRLQNLIDKDDNANESGEYHIRSLYFDDIDNSALADKLGGLRERAKYRIRIYNVQDDVIHFEKKIKMDDYIAKIKEPLTRGMYDELMAGNYEVLNVPGKPLFMELYDQMRHRLLRPKVIVDYVREPYVCHSGNVRITFDKELRTGLHATNIFDPELRPVKALEDDLIIFEVKFDEYIPDYIKIALQLEGLTRQSASKYVICRKFLKMNSWEDY
ncbi:polyphosphate polymerase domain-containing protein [Paenibacillus tepidiphilus]|uniref:polyphosphate polymerase domain-containing protein n=1 Tax=Paenibacillus tepidiphilus TaxID=2608683 RepID=UPI001239CE56|nr:polyphosphate polymerase domain-containing protein [Paenibacillus tepidiphilus]